MRVWRQLFAGSRHSAPLSKGVGDREALVAIDWAVHSESLRLPGCPRMLRRHPGFTERLRHPLLRASDNLIGEVGELVDGPGLDETDRPLLAGLVEKALARPEDDREDQ